jgi:hypothetical protein
MKHKNVDDKIYKIAWWTDRRREIAGPKDHRPDAPLYNTKVSQQEAEVDKQMDRSALMTQQMSMAQGAKGFFDPRSQYLEMLELMRNQKTGGGPEGGAEGALEQADKDAQKLKEWDASEHPQAKWFRDRHPNLVPKLGEEASPPAEGTENFDAAAHAKGMEASAGGAATPVVDPETKPGAGPAGGGSGRG